MAKFCVAASVFGLLPHQVFSNEDIAEALTAEAACADEGEECEAGLSLRQLRGELRMEQEDLKEKCVAAQQLCSDIMSWGGDQDRCRKEEAFCQVLGGAEDTDWICAPIHEECDEVPADADEEASADLGGDDLGGTDLGADLGASIFLGGALRGSCRARMCRVYLPGLCSCDKDCRDFATCCSDVDDHCPVPTKVRPPLVNNGLFHGSTQVTGHIMTLYHTTSRDIAEKIIHGGFKLGHTGWCGGGIYFINTPYLPKSKFAPGITKAGAILECTVMMGNMVRFAHHCKGPRGGAGDGVAGAKAMGYNSVTFSQNDGPEWVIWDTQQVLSVKIFKYT